MINSVVTDGDDRAARQRVIFEAMSGLHRVLGDEPMTEREARLVDAFHALCRRLGQAELPEASPEVPPEVVDEDLKVAPRLRPVLRGLLEGKAPKRIAFEAGLSLHTVYEYTKQLYRHYGVAGRGELLARFVKG